MIITPMLVNLTILSPSNIKNTICLGRAFYLNCKTVSRTAKYSVVSDTADPWK